MNPSLEEIREQLLDMMPALREKYGVVRFWIFGSRARGQERADSDLDLLVELGERTISLFEFAGLELDLEDALGLRVQVTEREVLQSSVLKRIEQDAVAV